MASEKLAYRDYVSILAEDHRGLVGLSRFLHRRSHWISAPTINLVDYHRGTDASTPPRIYERVSDQGIALLPEECVGRIIIVEDVDGPTIEHLGESLDIEPQFFARHLEATPPDPIDRLSATAHNYLPSAMDKGRIHFAYKVALDLGDFDAEGQENHEHVYESVANIKRDGVLLPYAVPNCQFAVLTGYTSMMLKKRVGSWICVILVDPATTVIRRKSHSPDGVQEVPCRLVRRTFVMSPIPTYSNFTSSVQPRSRAPTTVREKLVQAFLQDPPGLSRSSPSPVSLSFYPIQIVASEWIGNIRLMFQYLSHYQAPNQEGKQRLTEANLVALSNWRRQSYVSFSRLRDMSDRIRSYWIAETEVGTTLTTQGHAPGKGKEQKREEEEEAAAAAERLAVAGRLLAADIDYVSLQTQDLIRALDEKMQLIATVIQLLDTRRSVAEAVNVRRVTYVALVFVPLSWAAGLFSMSQDYSPGGPRFWVYCATAIPLVAAVFVICAMPVDRWAESLDRLWSSIAHRDAEVCRSPFAKDLEDLPTVSTSSRKSLSMGTANTLSRANLPSI
ncbi:hypothetical protein BX600DRAFT_110344 [Xylariales sp. PMI_506]|nr:hypothetical protein BX600DRAFT_110344 [Xylariales sp. PMI_506]